MNETVEEVKPAIITLAENENGYKCSSCIMHTLFFWIFFIINVGTGTCFVYLNWYLKKIHCKFTLILKKKQRFTKHINRKSQIY